MSKSFRNENLGVSAYNWWNAFAILLIFLIVALILTV